MEQLKAQLNTWLDSIGRENLVKYVAYYFVVYAILGVIAGVCLGVVGALLGGSAAMGAAAVGASGAASTAEGREALQAMSEAGALTGFTIVFAGLSAIAGIASLAAAVGLFQRKNWGRQLTIVALGIGLVSSVLGLGSSFTNIIWIIVNGILMYIFLTDEGVKAILSN